MAESSPTPTGLKPTLGLTGLTSNAMALIAPGAFLWLTFSMQSGYGQPAAGMSMWFGIVLALLLCLATAIAYAELSKLYPGAGSSYFFAEQAFLSKKQAFKWARLYKFMVGWASHLYYWVYPGVMVGVTAIVVGYMIGQIDSHFSTGQHFNSGVPSPIFMYAFCVLFAFGVAYIAFRGVGGATGVNAAINVIQITALLIFSCMAITHRLHVKEGQVAYNLVNSAADLHVQDTVPNMIPDPKDASKQIPDPSGATGPKMDASGNPIYAYYTCDAAGNIIQPNATGDTIKVDPSNNAITPFPSGTAIQIPTDAAGKPADPAWTVDKDGNFVLKTAVTTPAALPAGTVAKPELSTITYVGGILTDPKTGVTTSNYHISAGSVIAPHKFNYVFIQACVAILILVGFESVTSMGEEAKNAKKDIPKAVILSLLIQGGFCYLLEYFAANYFQSNCYTNTTAAGASAPIGDMCQLVGAWALGDPNKGWWFMMIEATTVFLALIGTTLSCLSTGARVTYAMGRDEEVSTHFGMLHGKNLTPHKAIWTLAILSSIIGIFAVALNFCGPAAQTDATLAALPTNWLYKIGIIHNAMAVKLPSSMLIVTLVSNFGTFLLYMMTCIVAIVAFREHHSFSGFKHMFVPIFGLLANLGCMVFYLVGPFTVAGMSKMEPFCALGVAAVWGIYGAIFFMSRSKKLGRSIMVQAPPTAAISA